MSIPESEFRMRHADGTTVTLHLPAPASTAAGVMKACSKLGFEFVRTDEPPRSKPWVTPTEMD